MAKGMYIGIDNKARKVKNIYIGVNGVARRVKKAYIGVGGYARLFYTADQLAYYGSSVGDNSVITGISYPKRNLKGISIGNYAIFPGGRNGNSYYQMVDKYDSSLTHAADFTLYVSHDYATTTVGNYALIGGGELQTSIRKYVYAITNSGTQYSNSISDLGQARSCLAATTVGTRAIFGGGLYGSTVYNNIDVYDSSLNKISTSNTLDAARSNLAATSVGGYAIFAGGDGGKKEVDAFDSSITKQTISDLGVNRNYLAAASIGDYALFAGGTTSTYIDVYKGLTRQSYIYLTTGRLNLVGISIGDYVLFAGGFTSTDMSTLTNTIEVFDKSLTKITDPVLTLYSNRANLAAATVGKYVLFAGGQYTSESGSAVSYVDVYKI